MTTDILLLIGRGTDYARNVLETHAERLARRLDVDDVRTAVYQRHPVRELRADLSAITADETYVVPFHVTYSTDTIDRIPTALEAVPGTVHYCEPPGSHPFVTEALLDRGMDSVPDVSETSLVLAALGGSAKSYYRQTAEYHAARLRKQSGYDDVLSCYLVQDPAVECVPYAVSTERTVIVPLFMTRTEGTAERIPEKLDFDRSDLEYAAPLSSHERVTDTIAEIVETRQRLAARVFSPSPEFNATTLDREAPFVVDGQGQQ